MKPLSIGFVLLSNSLRPIPSTRIAVLNMFPFLLAHGFELHILYEPDQPSERPDLASLNVEDIARTCQIVVFQKVCGASVEKLAKQLAREGVKTVYCVCDVVDADMAAATDATVVVTDYLKSLYPVELQAKIHVVHDGIEDPTTFRSTWRRQRGSWLRPLRAILVTSANMRELEGFGTLAPWLTLTILGNYPERSAILQRLRQAYRGLARAASMREKLKCLLFLLHPRIRCLPWSEARVRDLLPAADIGIIPIDTLTVLPTNPQPPLWMRKSENRLVLKMSARLPVIATPIPSYMPLVEQGVNGFLADSATHWTESLEALRDPALRESIGRKARASVVDRYSMQAQADALSALFHSLYQARC